MRCPESFLFVLIRSEKSHRLPFSILFKHYSKRRHAFQVSTEICIMITRYVKSYVECQNTLSTESMGIQYLSFLSSFDAARSLCHPGPTWCWIRLRQIDCKIFSNTECRRMKVMSTSVFSICRRPPVISDSFVEAFDGFESVSNLQCFFLVHVYMNYRQP